MWINAKLIFEINPLLSHCSAVPYTSYMIWQCIFIIEKTKELEEKLEEMSEKHQEQVSKANKDNSKLQQEAAHNKSRWWMIV